MSIDIKQFPKLILFLFVYNLSVHAFAQQDSLNYERKLSYKEGIYLSINDFHTNNPSITKSNLISKLDTSRPDFYSKATSKLKIRYKNQDNKVVKILSQNIWGLSEQNKVFIECEKENCQLSKIGALMWFNGFQTNFSTGSELMGHSFGTAIASGASMNGYPVLMGQKIYYFIDMKNLTIDILDPINLEIFLKRDKQLYNQYIKLSKGEKKDSLFIFVEKYNDKHTSISQKE